MVKPHHPVHDGHAEALTPDDLTGKEGTSPVWARHARLAPFPAIDGVTYMAMSSTRVSETPATAFLRKNGVVFTEHPYTYEEHGGTHVSSLKLGVPEHSVVKTLVMEDDGRKPLVVLMHGDRAVSTKNLARQIGQKRVEPCSPEVAQRHSGYQVGGTSPFGLRKPMPLYVERTILDLERIFINGGRRGFLVAIDPKELVRVLKATAVDVAIEK